MNSIETEMDLKEEIQHVFGLDNSRFSNYQSDLYIMVHGLNADIIYKFIERRGNHPIYFFSDVVGQPWHGKRCIDIPFAYDFRHKLSLLRGIVA